MTSLNLVFLVAESQQLVSIPVAAKSHAQAILNALDTSLVSGVRVSYHCAVEGCEVYFLIPHPQTNQLVYPAAARQLT